MKKIFVIAPDKSTGEAFNNELVKRGVDTYVHYAKIAPRVVDNKINTDPKVENDLKEAIVIGYNKGFNNMVIACNTLQFWLDKANELLPKEIGQNVNIITTFEVLKKKYPDKNQRPLLIGTTVTAKKIHDFPTLLSLGLDDIQDLVQEIIWRVKAVTGSEVATASASIDEIDSSEKLKEKTGLLVDRLFENNIKETILACTELPIAVKEYLDDSKKEIIHFVDPASLIAEYQSRFFR